MAIGQDNAAIAAQRYHRLFHAPRSQRASRIVRFSLARYHLHLAFVHLQHISISQYIALIGPVDGKHIFAAHLAQIALRIN